MVRRRALFQSIAAVVVFLSLIAPTCAADLSHLTSDDRQNIQIACVGARSSGPVAYNACVAQQTANLGQGHAADLSRLASDDRQNIQIACVGARSSGPVAYNACVAQQTASLAKDTPPTSPVSLPMIVRTSRLLAWARVAAGQSPTTPASPVSL